MNIKSVSQLRALLLEMETALGLVELSPNERDVLYAINEVAAGVVKAARSDAIRSHPLAAAIPQATYHRALKSLVQRGLVQHAPDTKAGAYIVTRAAKRRMDDDRGARWKSEPLQVRCCISLSVRLWSSLLTV